MKKEEEEQHEKAEGLSMEEKEKMLREALMKAAGVADWASLLAIEKLDLKKKGLKALPEGIGNLQQLKELNLERNKLEELP